MKLASSLCSALQYFPGQPAVRRFLRDVDSFLEASTDALTGADWETLLDSVAASSHGAELPPAANVWTGCKGSEEKFRGYPCGLWTLFHTLTVGAVEAHAQHVNGGCGSVFVKFL